MTTEKPVPGACALCCADAEEQSIHAPVVYGGTPEQAFWRCAECDAIYLYPRVSRAEEEAFYESEFQKWMTERSGDETWTSAASQFETMTKREMPLRLPWLRPLVGPGDRVVEAGSSSGFMLTALREWGCEVAGIEVSREYADHARGIGIPTYGSWEELESADSRPFDLATHYYVLEHVTDPLGFLEQCLARLAPGGRLVFEVPNANDPLSVLYKVPAFEEFFWWRAHHWYFTPRSLGWILDKLGRPYELHPGQRYDISNHMHWLMTGKPGGRGKYRHIFSEETECAYAEDLKRAWICDTIVAIVS